MDIYELSVDSSDASLLGRRLCLVPNYPDRFYLPTLEWTENRKIHGLKNK